MEFYINAYYKGYNILYKLLCNTEWISIVYTPLLKDCDVMSDLFSPSMS